MNFFETRTWIGPCVCACLRFRNSRMPLAASSACGATLRSGRRARRNQDILERDEFDIGYRILIAKVGRHDGG